MRGILEDNYARNIQSKNECQIALWNMEQVFLEIAFSSAEQIDGNAIVLFFGLLTALRKRQVYHDKDSATYQKLDTQRDTLLAKAPNFISKESALGLGLEVLNSNNIPLSYEILRYALYENKNHENLQVLIETGISYASHLQSEVPGLLGNQLVRADEVLADMEKLVLHQLSSQHRKEQHSCLEFIYLKLLFTWGTVACQS